VVLPHLLLLPFNSYVIIISIIVYIYLKFNNEKFIDIGFDISSFNLKSIFIGLGLSIILVVLSQYVIIPSLAQYFDYTDVEMYNQLKGNTEFYILMLLMGWVVGGFYEQLMFHGFIYNELFKIFPNKKILNFLITSTLFGVYHYQLGPIDAINALLIGVGYLAIVRIYKGDLWVSIFCHGFFNTIVISMLYFGLIV